MPPDDTTAQLDALRTLATDCIMPGARENMKQYGNLTPVIFLAKWDADQGHFDFNPVIIPPRMMQDGFTKDVLAHLIKRYLSGPDTDAVAILTEAWVKQVCPGSKDKLMDEYRKHGAVENMPGRYEVIFLNVFSRWGQLAFQDKIKRERPDDEDSKVIGFETVDMGEGWSTESRFDPEFDES